MQKTLKTIVNKCINFTKMRKNVYKSRVIMDKDYIF